MADPGSSDPNKRNSRQVSRSPLDRGASESSYPLQIDRAVQSERWGFGDAAGGIAAAFLLSNIVGAIIVAAAGWRSAAEIPIWGFGVLQIPLWAGYLGCILVAASKGSGLVEAFGLTARIVDPFAGILVGILSQLLLLPAIYLPIFHLTGKTAKDLSRPAERLASGAQSSWSWLLFALLVGLVAPVVEETFFRGLLLRSLSKRGASAAVAVLGSAAIFAGLHFQLLQLPGLFVFGVILAVMTVLTGRLGPAIFAHIGFNSTTVVVLYLDYRSRMR